MWRELLTETDYFDSNAPEIYHSSQANICIDKHLECSAANRNGGQHVAHLEIFEAVVLSACNCDVGKPQKGPFTGPQFIDLINGGICSVYAHT